VAHPALCPSAKQSAGNLLSAFGTEHCGDKLVMHGMQERSYATGLDTGCCYGDRLTAAVLPALKDWKLQAQSHEAASWRDLDKRGAKIISVPAHEKYYDVDPCD
jgi:hypothetical protein